TKDSAKEPVIKPSEKETALNIDRTTLNLIYKAVKDNSDESGWANLSVVGQYINMVRPDFDSRNYGRAKLSGLIKMLNLFETKIEGS
ncbi:OST-HTH/LOTUS domain-containing protein, partial [Acinetobacter baumannii]